MSPLPTPRVRHRPSCPASSCLRPDSDSPAAYTSRGDGGGDISRGFCAVCGSPVVARLSRLPDLIDVPAGSLDDPSWHKPMFDMFTASAQPWDHMHPDLPKFAAGPPEKN